MRLDYKGKYLFAFSDTHGMHRELSIPKDTDILICAGDVETDEYNFARFMEWYSNIPALLRLFVPGNMICHLTYIRLLRSKTDTEQCETFAEQWIFF